MKYPVYCVRDEKVAFWSPQVDQNEASAVRNFAMMVNNPGVPNFSPADFTLYRVGTFDSEKGVIEAESVPQFVISGPSVFGVKYEK